MKISLPFCHIQRIIIFLPPLFSLSLFVSFFSPSLSFFFVPLEVECGENGQSCVIRATASFTKLRRFPWHAPPAVSPPPPRLTPNLTMKHHQIFQVPSQPMQQEPLRSGRAPHSTNYSKILSDSERCVPPWVWDRLKPTQEPCWGHRPSHRVIHADLGCDDSCRLGIVMMQEGRRC